MSQNSLVLPTSGTLSGLAAVEAINAANDTLNTLASGASAPSSPEAGQLWHDTTNNLLKIRSLDNTTWISVGSIDETNYLFSATSRPTPPVYGLTISNDTSSPNSVIDIAPGGASDTTVFQYIRLGSSIKKAVNTAWAVGSGNGSLDTGSIAANSAYHVHLIVNPTTGIVDALTSLSYSNPTLPSGYTKFSPIGAIMTDGSSNVRQFVQYENEFLYVTGIVDFDGNPAAVSLKTLTVPTGLKVNALFRGMMYNASSSAAVQLFYCPDEGTQTPQNQTSGGTQNASLSTNNNASTAGEFNVRTNTSGQISVVGAATTPGSVRISIWTRGFIYRRGPP